MQSRKRKRQGRQKTTRAKKAHHIEEASVTETNWQDLPVELGDIILHYAAQNSYVSAVVIPFVCRRWHERKPFWKPSYPELKKQSIFNHDYNKRVAMEEAAFRGWVHTLKWLRGQGCQ